MTNGAIQALKSGRTRRTARWAAARSALRPAGRANTGRRAPCAAPDSAETSLNRFIIEATVPPEKPPRIVRTRIFTWRQGAPKRCRARACRKCTPRSNGTESNPQQCTIRAPVRRAVASCLLDHAPHPLHFAGQVAVVGAGLGTSLHERLAIQRIRAHGGDDDARPCGRARASRRGRRPRRPSSSWSFPALVPERLAQLLQLAAASGRPPPSATHRRARTARTGTARGSGRRSWWRRRRRRRTAWRARHAAS